MNNRGAHEEPVRDEPPARTKGRDFEPEDESSKQKTEHPATSYHGPRNDPEQSGKKN